MGLIRTVLTRRAAARWRDLLPVGAEPWQVLSVLLALLELAKLGELRLAQGCPFGPMEIRRDAASQAA
jgi:segregation and condensation protein A